MPLATSLNMACINGAVLVSISETDLIAISTSEIDNDCNLSKPDDVVLKEEQATILEDDSDNWHEEHSVAEIQVERFMEALLILYDNMSKTKANINFTENLIVFLLFIK